MDNNLKGSIDKVIKDFESMINPEIAKINMNRDKFTDEQLRDLDDVQRKFKENKKELDKYVNKYSK